MAKGNGDAPDAGSDQLTRPLHTRVSARAEELLGERARADGLKPGTWVRILIYKALGIIGPGPDSKKRATRS